MDEVLRVANLKTYFDTQDGVVKAVDDVSFEVHPGEVLGLVGESGSGKSMTCRSIMRVLPYSARIAGGSIFYDGQDIMKWPDNRLKSFRGSEVSMILQEPMTALNPVLTVGEQIVETVVQHENLSRADAQERAIEMLRLVGIPSPERRVKEYPHEFSGGMRQRAMIAIALACRPKILLADEPTTALDVTIQDQIIRLIQGLQAELNMGVVWVTHDLGVVAQICDRVIVMYAGQIMESAGVIELFEQSRHPYTEGLMASIPRTGSRQGQLRSIPGQPPNLRHLPPGCPFEPRCRYAASECKIGRVSLREVSPGHHSACIRFEEIWS